MLAFKKKTVLTFVFFNILFVVAACLLVAVPVTGHKKISGGPAVSSVAELLLLDECPLTAAIANGIFMLITFAVSVPGILFSRSRVLLKAHSWLLVFNAVFSLGVGLSIWFQTLQTKNNLAPVFNKSSPAIKSLVQQRFQCCGYDDIQSFALDSLCTSQAVAAAKGSCMIPFSAFANSFLDIVFTAIFGICAVDGLLLLAGLCVIKERNEEYRYELIDEKKRSASYSNGIST